VDIFAWFLSGVLVAGLACSCSGAPASALFGPAPTQDSGVGRDASGMTRDSGVSHPPDSGGSMGNDAQPPPHDAAPPPGDAAVFDSAPPPPVTFACATAGSCSTPDGTCCATQGDGILTQTSYACVSGPSVCSGVQQVPIECHDEGDCPAQEFCCGLNNGSAYLSVGCEATCPENEDAGVDEYFRFCDPNHPTVCTAIGLQCSESGILPGFYRCD
jgi:hypothetical protein